MLNPSSFASLCSYIASHVHLAKALYSDSHEDLDVDFYFFEDQEIGVELFMNIYALIVDPSSRFPV